MNLGGLILVAGSLLAATAAFIWMAVSAGGGGKKKGPKDFNAAADADVERIFNEDFREELRNRGRLHFENIIRDNAMFLQQDLRLTTSQLNDYMKQEIAKTLQESFDKYEQSVNDAKQMAVDSIKVTQETIEQQRQMMGEQLQSQVTAERDRLIKRFETNMAEIVNHYIVAAIGDQIDLSDQLEYILGDLEANKEAIVEDLRSGA